MKIDGERKTMAIPYRGVEGGQRDSLMAPLRLNRSLSTDLACFPNQDTIAREVEQSFQYLGP